MCVPQSLAVSVTIAISLRSSYTRFMNSTVAAQSKTRPFVRRLFTWRTVLLLWKRAPLLFRVRKRFLPPRFGSSPRERPPTTLSPPLVFLRRSMRSGLSPFLFLEAPSHGRRADGRGDGKRGNASGDPEGGGPFDRLRERESAGVFLGHADALL